MFKLLIKIVLFYSTLVIASKHNCERWFTDLEEKVRIIPDLYAVDFEHGRGFLYEKAVTYCRGQEKCRNIRTQHAQDKIVEIAKKLLKISDHVARNELIKCYEDADAAFVCIEERRWENCDKWFTELEGKIKIIPRDYTFEETRSFRKRGGECTYEKAVSHCHGKEKCWNLRHPKAYDTIVEIAKKHLMISDDDARNELIKCYEEDYIYFVCIEETTALVDTKENCKKWLTGLEGKIRIIPRTFGEQVGNESIAIYCQVQEKLWSLRHPKAHKKITEIAKKYLTISDHDARNELIKCYQDAATFVCVEEISQENCAKWFNKLQGKISMIPLTPRKEFDLYCQEYGTLCLDPRHPDAHNNIVEIAKRHLEISDLAAEHEVTKCYEDTYNYVDIQLSHENCKKWFNDLKEKIDIMPPIQIKEQDPYCNVQGKRKWSPRSTEAHKRIVEIAKKHLRISDYAARNILTKCFEEAASYYVCIEEEEEEEEERLEEEVERSEEKCQTWLTELGGKLKTIPHIPYEEWDSYCHKHGKKRWNPRHPDARNKIVEIAKKHLKISDHDARNKLVKCYEDAVPYPFVCIEEQEAIPIIFYIYVCIQLLVLCVFLGLCCFFDPPSTSSSSIFSSSSSSSSSSSESDTDKKNQ